MSKKYIASLPSTNSKETPKDLGYRMIKGDLKKVVNKGKDPKSNVTIMYYGETNYDSNEAYLLKAVGDILTIKLTEVIREQESGVYTVNARGSMNKVPYSSYNFTISFPCGPENTEKLITASLAELNKIIANGPTQADLDKFKQAEILDYKKQIKENRYWMSNFIRSFNNSSNPEDILEVEAKINAVTLAQVQEVAKKYLSKDKIIGVLMPE